MAVSNMQSGGLLLLAVFLYVMLSGCGGSSAPTAPTGGGLSETARAHLNQLVAYMQGGSVRRLTIDWTDFRARVFAEAGGAQTIPQLVPAIRLALTLLSDNHSSYRAVSGEVVSVRNRSCGAPAAGMPRLPATIGYVKVPTFSGSAAEATQLANTIQRSIREADRDGLVGWIVDVRGNGGGNMWPMIAGVGPVLGDGVAGHFIAPGNLPVPWGYRPGASWSDEGSGQQVSSPYRLRRERPRVAVLTDGAIASSGEAVVIAFKRRPDTRSFGTPTCGLSTANEALPMDDGATLLLTVAVMADRERTPYGDSVVPDEHFVDTGEAVQRAIEWLRGD
jgi:carboxyl-terminal processing protease